MKQTTTMVGDRLKKHHRFQTTVFVITGVLLCSSQLTAAVYNVSWGLAWPGFMPQTVTILPGDTVVWTNHETSRSMTWLRIASDDANGPDNFSMDYLGWGLTGSHTFYSSGTHTYTGVYHDQYGEYSHDPATVIVKSPLPLANPKYAAGKFTFDATELTAGSTNILQCCSNLAARNWTTISSNVASGPTMSFTNAVGITSCFYRAIEIP